MKSQAVRDMAERMYVQDGRTYREIAEALEVTEKTVWSWGNPAAGNWDGKRDAFLKSKKMLHEELYNLVRKLARSIREDIENGREPSKSRCDLFKNLTASIKTTREYEEAMKAAREDEDAAAKKGGITPEQIAKIEEEVFGVSQ
jgi:isopropylmalate/homocitrate/citramalate synthase